MSKVIRGRAPYTLFLGFAAVLVFASIGVALTTSSDDPSAPLPRPVASGIDSRLHALKVFRRQQRESDILSPDARRTLKATSPLGTNVALARHARRGPDGQDYYLVPGANSVALVNAAGVGAIDDIDHALSGQSVGTEDCAMGGRGIRVVGLLPDSAEEPRMQLSGGSTIEVEVENNVYIVELLKSPATLPVKTLWTQDGQAREAAIPVPHDILTGVCYRTIP